MPDLGDWGAAGLWITGFGAGWTFAIKILVQPLTKRLDSAEADMKRIDSTLRERWLNGQS